MIESIKSAWKTRSGKMLLSTTALIMFGFGCLSGTTPVLVETEIPAATQTPAPTVVLTLAPHIDGNILIVEGTTDLPNGTFISYEVRHEQLLTNFEIPYDNLFVDGNIEASKGIYSRQVNLSGWLAGNLEIWVAFQTILSGDVKQPPEIIARFGELGELLQGDNVNSSTSLKRVELIKTLSFNP